MEGGWAPPGGRATGAGGTGSRGGSRWECHRPKTARHLSENRTAGGYRGGGGNPFGGGGGLPSGIHTSSGSFSAFRSAGYAARAAFTSAA